MFRGINVINVDSKGRIIMPTRYRDRIKEEGETEVVVTIDTEATCLLLYPISEWEIIEKKIEALPSFNRVTRRIQRLLIGHATEIEMDNNGRILIPPLLREYAKLKRKVVLVGQGKKFELWDEELWHHGRGEWLAEQGKEDEEIPVELQSIAL